jgi:hypothetical protein
MSVPLWEGEYRSKAQEVITERLAARKDTGWVADPDHTFRMRALQAWSKGKIEADVVILKTLGRMKERGLTTVEDFEAVHAELRAEWARQSNEQKTQWEFYVPLAMKSAADLSLPVTIPVLGRQFVLKTWQETETGLGRPQIDDAFSRAFCDANKFPEVCLTFSGDGVNAHAAWNHAAPGYDLFRGLLEFVHGFFCWSHHWGRPKARVRFPQWPWVLAVSPGKPMEVIQFITDEPPSPHPQVLEAKRLAELVKYATKFANEPPKSSTLALLTDSLRLYSQALDERFRHTCLLGLWQMAETLTLSNRFGGDTKMVTARLVAMIDKRLKPEPVGLPEILRDIADKRNRIVHHGIHDTVDDEDINILESVCEMSLWCVFHDAEKLPTQDHLNHYLTLRSRPRAELEVMGHALNRVTELDRQLSTAKWPDPKKEGTG